MKKVSPELLEKFFINLGKGYRNPNCGGCGAFAYAASRMLDSLNISHSIVVQCFSDWQVDGFVREYGELTKSVDRHYNDYLADAENGRGYYGLHNHIVIRVNGVYYDAEGICKDRAYSETLINIKTLKRAVAAPIWNDTFTRKNNGVSVTQIANKAERLANKILSKNLNKQLAI